jgi:transcriptional regulator GlxA family with amidase domain
MQRVLIVGFDGVTTLDVTGPADVFAAASEATDDSGYRVVLASVGGGARRSSSSLVLATEDLLALQPQADDLVLVAGGPEAAIGAALKDTRLIAWVRAAGQVARRVASVCSGAFVLGAAGLLDGRRATTHWLGCDRFAAMFPRVHVDANAIFVQDGAVWTSAGVTTGIDMALAMVEEDLGAAIADAIAARLVLCMRRPGFQSQFSDSLVAQLESSDPLRPVVSWIRAHLARADVETVARENALSVRTLHRRCREQLGLTPAKLIQKLRVEHARSLLAGNELSAKSLATLCGFGSATHLKRAFEREFGMGPRDYRLLHARPASELAASA